MLQRCAGCGAEVFPREKRCGGCGQPAGGARAAVLLELEPAPPHRRFLAALVDSLLLLIFLQAVFRLQPGTWALCLAAALLYWGLLGARGRQTPGQALLGTIVLTENRQPLAVGKNLLRTLLSLVWAATIVLPVASLRLPAADLPQRLTASREWRAPAMG